MPYDEIIGWRCSDFDFGFGDVRRAYQAGLETGLPVDQVLALLVEANMRWEIVESELGIPSASDDLE